MVVSNKNNLKSPDDVKKVAEELAEHLELMKLQLFSPTGEVIFSSDPEDIGTINDKRYFHEIVARGNPYTKVVQKNSKSSEGQVVAMDVVETYVPIMDGERFIGAFEIYYDITSRTQRLHSIVFRSSLIPIVVMAIFLVLFITMLARSDREMINVQNNEMSVRYQSPFYSLLMITISIFTAESVVMLLIDKLPSMSPLNETIFDSSLLVLFVSPVLYFSLLRPLILNISERRRVEEQLRHYTDNLEELVQERSFELSQTNIQLENENIKLKDLQNQLLHAQKMESIGRLSGGIAHDFNNIIAGITGLTLLIKRRMEDSDPLRLYVEQIETAADKAAKLTTGLLAFSRKQKMNLTSVNMNKAIRKLVNILEIVIGEQIEFNISLAERELNIMADHTQLEQVLMNLATNARDAMPQGGSLTIRTEFFEMSDKFIRNNGYGIEGEYVLVSISDTGMGMDTQEMEQIFEPFFTTKDVNKGTGLGLSIVYGIVKQHNGYIAVESKPREGTTFRLYLPVAATAVQHAPSEQSEVYASIVGKETILVAEDDALLRNVLTSVLEEFGYRTVAAEDGEDAVNKFVEHQDDVQFIISDIKMPKKSGKDAYKEIKTIRPEMKCLFLSAYSEELMHEENIPDEDFHLMSKPVKPEHLIKEMREMLDTD